MPDELENFQSSGLSWSERATQYTGISAVYSPKNYYRSLWLASLSTIELRKMLKSTPKNSIVVDFGCGVGHHSKLISNRVKTTVGLDITFEMLKQAREIKKDIVFGQIDGINLPLKSETVDRIWICGVLRYSLSVPNPKHKDIVKELFRVLKPGGYVFNYEMYVDQPSEYFSKDFISSGLLMRSVSICNIHNSRLETTAIGRYRKVFLNRFWSTINIWYMKHLIREENLYQEIRDYIFIYQKPELI